MTNPDFNTRLSEVNKDNFKTLFKRIMRQLDGRQQKVFTKQKPDKYYQNKRAEFVALIDKVVNQGWFKIPKSGTRIYKIYHDKWED